MRTAICTCLLLVVTPTVDAKAIKPDRRCAYLGNWGSFHIVGSVGTAAYALDDERYIADLEFAGEDADYWAYRPTKKGDPNTTLWAFAKKPICGKYWVLRQSRGAWRKYEATDAWGEGHGNRI